MQPKYKQTILATAFLAATTLAGGAQSLITGIYSTRSSAKAAVNGISYEAANTINGLGLNPSNTREHAATYNNWSGGHSWYSDVASNLGTTGSGFSSDEWIQWDLGMFYTLDSIHVWNLNRPADQPTKITNQRGLHIGDIYFSSVANPGDPEGAGAGDWILWYENAVFQQANGIDSYTGFDLETQMSNRNLPTGQIRHVRFEVDYNFSMNEQEGVGLSEIQFNGLSAVPEPSAALLGCLGALAILRRRRD